MGEATAKTHVSSVLLKLGVRDRVQAVIAAYESGFALRGRDAGRLDLKVAQTRVPGGWLPCCAQSLFNCDW